MQKYFSDTVYVNSCPLFRDPLFRDPLFPTTATKSIGYAIANPPAKPQDKISIRNAPLGQTAGDPP
ncbi:MAG: hypothetical protein F6J98_36855 [Moorea sp. SIO4G2]|nr:hypothetical protein [Moorena sp. SIO4G2]